MHADGTNPRSTPQAGVCRLLVLEDNEGDLAYLEALLANRPFMLRGATRLDEAIALAKLTPFDVALLDLSVPDSDGIATFAHFHAAIPTLPVVVLTGAGSTDKERDAIRKGAMDFLAKRNLTTDTIERTIRFALERAEHRSELLRHKRYLDAVGQSVICVDGEGLVTYWNKAATDLYGWVASDVMGRRLSDVGIADILPSHRAEIFSQIRAGNPWAGEFTGIRRDGSRFPGYVVNTPVLDAQGAVVGIIGTSHDMTSSKRHEATLRDAVNRARAAQKLAGMTVWRVDLVSRDATWDEEAYTRAGLDPNTHQATLDSSLGILAEEDQQRLKSWLASLEKAPTSLDIEVRLPLPDGDVKILHLMGEPTFDRAGRPISVSGMTQDITEKRRRDAEVDAMRRTQNEKERLSALGTLVAGVAHEINNPLSYVQGSAELALMSLDDAKEDPITGASAAHLREHLAQVLRGVETMTRITRSLKEISRAPNGMRAREHLLPLIENIVTVAESRIPAEVEVRCVTTADVCAEVNKGELGQVVLNLLINAGEAVGARGGTVVIRIEGTPQGPTIDVIDDGPGISPEVAAQLFTPFFSTKPEGTGLGLSLSRRIVEDHGGQLTFQTTPGKGTTFRIALPK